MTCGFKVWRGSAPKHVQHAKPVAVPGESAAPPQAWLHTLLCQLQQCLRVITAHLTGR